MRADEGARRDARYLQPCCTAGASSMLEALSVDDVRRYRSVRLTLDEKKRNLRSCRIRAGRLPPRTTSARPIVGRHDVRVDDCVQKNELWGYVEGEEVIPLKYKWAGDFDEGRAAVIETDARRMR
ncbi:MAG: WG repeat-containing protein [Alistipes onderdonkii]